MMKMPDVQSNKGKEGGGGEGRVDGNTDTPTDLLRRTRISFLVTSGLVIVFTVSYGYLEYYYINDPVLGKTANLTVKS